MSEPVKALIIGVPVAADGRPAGVLRFGHVSGYPMTAAACAVRHHPLRARSRRS